MKTIECYSCAVVFGVPDQWYANRLEDQKQFYCPNGHAQSFCGETEVAKERRLRQRAEQQIARAEEEKRAAEARAVAAEKKTQRIQKRVNAGVCLDCNRTFANVARHRATKHGPTCESVAKLKVVK